MVASAAVLFWIDVVSTVLLLTMAKKTEVLVTELLMMPVWLSVDKLTFELAMLVLEIMDWLSVENLAVTLRIELLVTWLALMKHCTVVELATALLSMMQLTLAALRSVELTMVELPMLELLILARVVLLAVAVLLSMVVLNTTEDSVIEQFDALVLATSELFEKQLRSMLPLTTEVFWISELLMTDVMTVLFEMLEFPIVLLNTPLPMMTELLSIVLFWMMD